MLHLLTHGFNRNKYTYLNSIKLVTYIVHLEVSGEVVLQLLTFVISGS
jgi:hypothetical protein